MKNPFRKSFNPLHPAQIEYLELLKKPILNSIYPPDAEVELGKIWPEFPTLSIIGKPRLDNITAPLVRVDWTCAYWQK